jgi:integrase
MSKKITRIEYNELKERLINITRTDHKLLLKTIYACCGRVGEIVNSRYVTYPGKPFAYRNLTWTDNILLINILTEKTHVERTIPLARIDAPAEAYFQKNESWLTEDIIEYAKDNKDAGSFFGYSTRWAERVFAKYFPEHNQHIHLLRHWRATHLLSGEATGINLPTNLVMRIGGWTEERTLNKIYNSTIVSDYIKMK